MLLPARPTVKFLAFCLHHSVPGVLDLGLCRLDTLLPICFERSFQHNRQNSVSLSTYFHFQNGIMTERGVGRYPYLHRQTVFISIHYSACVLSFCFCFSRKLFEETRFESGVRSLPSSFSCCFTRSRSSTRLSVPSSLLAIKKLNTLS